MNPIYIIIGVVLVLIYALFSMKYTRKQRGEKIEYSKAYLKKYPHASKVYIQWHEYLLFSLEISVFSVDNKDPAFFREGLKKGFYLSQGEHVVSMQAVTDRPGILHRRVTTTYGPEDVRISSRNNINYKLSLKNKRFIIK